MPYPAGKQVDDVWDIPIINPLANKALKCQNHWLAETRTKIASEVKVLLPLPTTPIDKSQRDTPFMLVSLCLLCYVFPTDFARKDGKTIASK